MVKIKNTLMSIQIKYNKIKIHSHKIMKTIKIHIDYQDIHQTLNKISTIKNFKKY
jgi:hypothetical protein